MKHSRNFLIKAIALISLILVFRLANQDTETTTQSAIDHRAALLVFIAPICVFVFFQKESLRLSFILKRIRELFQKDTDSLSLELEKSTLQARGQYGYSYMTKMSENHPDSTVRYAGEIFSARFSSQEMAQLLMQKIQTEESYWQNICSSIGFLAKMAPYFGMLATVLGMIKLLENMSDFSHISASMALAMQGTLYGLVSFTVFYSPLQRYFSELKNQILRRNEMIARWFVSVTQQIDPAYIQQEVRSLHVSHESESNGASAQAAPQSPRSST
jgi:flagellar motor component MotA